MKYIVTLNNIDYEVEVEESNIVLVGQSEAAPVPVTAVSNSAPMAASAAPAVHGTTVASPMPGTILDVRVTQGQAVKSGDLLMILETMKMENEIVSPAEGTVVQLAVQKGSVVDTDAVLAVIG